MNKVTAAEKSKAAAQIIWARARIKAEQSPEACSRRARVLEERLASLKDWVSVSCHRCLGEGHHIRPGGVYGLDQFEVTYESCLTCYGKGRVNVLRSDVRSAEAGLEDCEGKLEQGAQK